MDSIHWIASFPKSGNTWVRAFLHAHLTGTLDINRISIPSDTSSKLYRSVSARSDLTFAEQRLVRPAALLNGAHWRQPLYMKTHAIFDPLLEELNGPSIYLIRDPRDVAASIIRHADLSVSDAIKVVNDGAPWRNNGVWQDVRSWDENVRSWEHNATVIRYEDLRSAPKLNFGRILETLEIEGSPAKAIKMASLENMRAQEQAHGFKEKFSDAPFFRQGKVGGWKDVLSQAQADAIVFQNKNLMDRYGYL